MSASTPGRNDPCPCGSGRKFKHCCLDTWGRTDSARLAIRGAEGRVVDALLGYIAEEWGGEFLQAAWEEFFLWEDVPDNPPEAPEFEGMFVPWLTLMYVPDPSDEDLPSGWPVEPVGLHWLREEQPELSDLERGYVHAACASPTSVFVVEAVSPGRSLDLTDILTGRRFEVLEAGASKTLKAHDLVFTRVVTVGGSSVMLGAAPFVIPSSWHTHVIEWREHHPRNRGHRLMTRADLFDYDIEIRELYLTIADELLDPTPPTLTNTDGDPLVFTRMTFEVEGAIETLIDRLRVLTGGTGGADPGGLEESVESRAMRLVR